VQLQSTVLYFEIFVRHQYPEDKRSNVNMSTTTDAYDRHCLLRFNDRVSSDIGLVSVTLL